MIEILPLLVLSAALVYVLHRWRQALRAEANARRAMQTAREQRDTAKMKAAAAVERLHEIRPLLNLPANAKLCGFSYCPESQTGETHRIVIELDRRFMGSGAGTSWKAATDEALRFARQQEHFRITRNLPSLFVFIIAMLALNGCAGLVCPPKFLDPDYCYAWGR